MPGTWIKIGLDFVETQTPYSSPGPVVDTSPLSYNGEVLPDLWQLFGSGHSQMQDVHYSYVTHATEVACSPYGGTCGPDCFNTIDKCWHGDYHNNLVYDFYVAEVISDAEFLRRGEPLWGPDQTFQDTDYRGYTYSNTQPTYRWFQYDVSEIDCDALRNSLDDLSVRIEGYERDHGALVRQQAILEGDIDALELRYESASEVAVSAGVLIGLETVLIGGSALIGDSALNGVLKGIQNLAPSVLAGAINTYNDQEPTLSEVQQDFLSLSSEAFESLGDSAMSSALSKFGKAFGLLGTALGLKDFHNNVKFQADELVNAKLDIIDLRADYSDKVKEYTDVSGQLMDLRHTWTQDYGEFQMLKSDFLSHCDGNLGPVELAPDQDSPTNYGSLAAIDVLDNISPPQGGIVFDNFYSFQGRNRADLKSGGSNDMVLGNGRGNEISLGGGADIAFGKAGDDLIKGGRGRDWLIGNSGEDKLYGNRGHDLLAGGNGNDKLVGGNGNDILVGGRGCDVMIGGKGADVFVFENQHSSLDCVDIIRDFQPGTDRIDLQDFQFGNFVALVALIDQVGDNVVVMLSGQQNILLQDVELADLGASDFIL